MFDQKTLSEKIKNYRKTYNFTQEELAEKIGVSGQAVSKWESGECLPDIYNLCALGEIFDISLDILLKSSCNNNLATTTQKIKQLATEYIWSNINNRNTHVELGDDLWEMWKAIYFVEIGNKEFQEREIARGKYRINSEYGIKVWDDNGIVCVVKSKIIKQLGAVSDRENEIITTLTERDYFLLLSNIDSSSRVSKNDLIEKTGLITAKLNDMLIYLMENKIVEYYTTPDGKSDGYKLTAGRGIIGYMVLAMNYLLTSCDYSTSEYVDPLY